MIQGLKITLCLPCRNEGAHLKEVVEQLPDYIDEIIVISNKSTDNTMAIARKIGGRVKVIKDDRTLNGIGYGYAHMSGIAAAAGDIIVGADGDATYPINNIDKVVRYLLKNQLEFISCSRYPLQANTRISLKLRVGVSLLNWEVMLLYGFKINDILSGMWVFRSEIRDKLELTMGDWNLSPQIKINARRNPLIKFKEYPITQHDRMGETKQNYFKTGYAHASWIFKNRFSPK